VIPKEQYLVSLYDDVYCALGINNTETCKILLDADQMTKNDFVNDFNSTAPGVNIYENISDEWTLKGDEIFDSVNNTWQNDENVTDGSYFVFIPPPSFSFIGRVVTTSNGIWFKEGDNQRILVENRICSMTCGIG